MIDEIHIPRCDHGVPIGSLCSECLKNSDDKQPEDKVINLIMEFFKEKQISGITKENFIQIVIKYSQFYKELRSHLRQELGLKSRDTIDIFDFNHDIQEMEARL